MTMFSHNISIQYLYMYICMNCMWVKSSNMLFALLTVSAYMI